MTELSNFYIGLEKFVSPLVEGEIKGGKFSLKDRNLDDSAKVKAAFIIVGLVFLNIIALAAFCLLSILRANLSKSLGNDPAAPPVVPATPVVPASTVVSIAPSLFPAPDMDPPTGEGNSSIPKPQAGMAPPVCFKESKPPVPFRAKRVEQKPLLEVDQNSVQFHLRKMRASMHPEESESDSDSDSEPGFESG